jgi:hypothetical protein
VPTSAVSHCKPETRLALSSRLLTRQGYAYEVPTSNVMALSGVAGSYSPTADAAFSLNRLPSRICRLNTVMLLWPIVWAITRSWTPAFAADVAIPAGSEWPDTSLASMPANSARLFTT